MTNEILKSLSKEDLYEGVQLCRKCMEMHFSVAKILAEKEFYGPAVSHLILSAEEGIKTQIILSQFFGVDIKDVNVKKIFTNHYYKLDQIKDFQGFILFLKPILDSIKIIGDKRKTVLEKFLQTSLEMSKMISTEKKIEQSLIWLRQANNQKQKGFYGDYVNKNWISPFTFSKTDFDESLTAIMPLYEFTCLLNKINLKDYNLIERFPSK